MARSPRIAVSGYPHHVIQRGNNRQAIFLSDEDYKFYIDCFLRAKEKYRCRIYAYCLMSNHVHFLIEPSDSQGLSGLLQSVGRRYVQYFNWRHRRSGTLWEGRFRSSLVSMDDYLLACGRYIELNPVRAIVVAHPRDYRWSSYRFHGEGTKDALLDVDSCYLGMGDSDSQSQQSYRQFIEAGNPEHELAFLRTSVQRGGVTGSQSYIRGFPSRLSRQLELRPRGRPRTVQK